MSKRLILSVVAGTSFLFASGMFAGFYQTFPFDQLRYVKNLVAPPEEVPVKTLARGALFDTFNPKSDVVMVGDSLTARVVWSDAFPNVKIANRGMGGDKTQDILDRMDTILSLEPKKALIMVGINDFYANVPQMVAFENYKEIVRILRANDIEVVIQSTIECYKPQCGGNLRRVRWLNAQLKKFSIDNSIEYIDLNESLSAKVDGLMLKYTHDGTHLMGSGYLAWADAIKTAVH